MARPKKDTSGGDTLKKSYRFTKRTADKIERLAALWNCTQTQVIEVLVEEVAEEEPIQ